MNYYNIPKWLYKYLSQEDYFTIRVANYLKTQKVLFHHTFNEGKRTRTFRNKLIGFGVMTGIPDIIIFEPKGDYVGLAIELKVIYANGKKNYCSSSQKEAQKNLCSKGWKCVTVWDFEQFEKEFKKYFN